MLQDVLLFLLLSMPILADKYRFSITNIDIHATLGLTEDDTFVAISAIGSKNSTSSYGATSFDLSSGHKAGDTISSNNLTQDFEVKTDDEGLGVVFSIMNIGKRLGGAGRDSAAISSQLEKKMLRVTAGEASGTDDLHATGMKMLKADMPDMLECSGPVFLQEYLWPAASLQALTPSKPICKDNIKQDYPKTCGSGNSSYEITYCLEVVERSKAGDAADGPRVQAGAGCVVVGIVIPVLAGLTAVMFAWIR